MLGRHPVRCEPHGFGGLCRRRGRARLEAAAPPGRTPSRADRRRADLVAEGDPASGGPKRTPALGPWSVWAGTRGERNGAGRDAGGNRGAVPRLPLDWAASRSRQCPPAFSSASDCRSDGHRHRLAIWRVCVASAARAGATGSVASLQRTNRRKPVFAPAQPARAARRRRNARGCLRVALVGPGDARALAPLAGEPALWLLRNLFASGDARRFSRTRARLSIC